MSDQEQKTKPDGGASVSTARLEPIVRLTMGEERFILNSPAGLLLLMKHEDTQYAQAESRMGPDKVGPWPTRRYKELYERGRSIVGEDLEIWPDHIVKAFGFMGSNLF